MSNLRLVYAAVSGEFEQAITAMQRPIALAATAAITEAGDQVKRAVRADIAAAGFSGRWQNAFRAQVYPKGGAPSINAAVHFFDKIQYASVFEEGASIFGKPLLWLPIEKNLPTGAGGRSWSPLRYSQQVGPLTSVNVPGRPPMLFGLIKTSRRGKVLSGRRQTFLGFADKGITKNLPLFVGIDVVKISKKFHITEIIRRVGATIGDLYQKHLRSEDR